MPNPTKLKQTFLNKWLQGLEPITSPNTNMNFLETKKAIKMSSDLAIAATRNGATLWSRAIISKSVNGYAGRQAPREVISSRRRNSIQMKTLKRLRTTGRSQMVSRSLARSVAKRLVRKRTKVLRSLVPGGEFMKNEVLLIEEALDYISFLQVQVDGMRFLANCI